MVDQPRLSLRMLRCHQICDSASGVLISFLILFSPWAFGTTQFWSIWTMNATGYFLGALLGLKIAIRFSTGHRQSNNHSELLRKLVRALTVLTFLIIGYCFVSALNARAAWD